MAHLEIFAHPENRALIADALARGIPREEISEPTG
jgi:hypothetical protein